MVREIQRHSHSRVGRVLLIERVKNKGSQDSNNECDTDSTPEGGLCVTNVNHDSSDIGKAYGKGLKGCQIKLKLDITEKATPSQGNRTESVSYISHKWIVEILYGRSNTICV